jgi:hypothetical protein
MAETEQAPKDFLGFLDFYLVKKAPFQIPDGGREWLVKYGPWIIIIMLVLTLPLLLFVLGVGTVFMPFGGYGYAAGFGILTIFVLAQIALEVIALPGLFARKMSGWNFLFYSRLVGVLGSLTAGSIIGGLLGLVISLYILFQVRGLYH